MSLGVTVWTGRVADDGPAPETALLSGAELARMRRIRRPLAARRWASAHAALRRILAERTGSAPGSLRIGRSACPHCGSREHGPPALLDPPVPTTFSLSRSGPHWTVAVAPGFPVGVDVERQRPVDVDAIARRALSAHESRLVASSGPALLFRCWTRKEAVAKAMGTGIATDLRRIETRPESARTARTPAGWRVHSLPVPAGLHAALAVPDVPAITWRARTWPPDADR
ncbi:4'-phosphopantetheinyl transferase family protein [Kitasatospora sp. NBC_01539]|uniref:4'-phosphopantetheinyl transferase family protein n=1 Tax=Kitasatospora sp. NBC_01539 TaxID=2903577 RepID=UPI00386030EB